MDKFAQGKARSSPGAGTLSLIAQGAGSTIRLLAALIVALGMLLQTGVAAEEPGSYAGIVIRPGDGTVTYAYVPLVEEITGIELLRRSGVSLVTVGFGGLGEGVCQIEQTGCEVGPCRSRLCQTGDRESPYWRYFQPDVDGQWVASPLGGSTTKVAPGEVDGWSWTPDEPMLPVIDIGDIPRLAGADGDPDRAHFARYDANGALVDRTTARELEQRSYIAVIGMLTVVAGFAVALKLRPKSSA